MFALDGDFPCASVRTTLIVLGGDEEFYSPPPIMVTSTQEMRIGYVSYVRACVQYGI